MATDARDVPPEPHAQDVRDRQIAAVRDVMGWGVQPDAFNEDAVATTAAELVDAVTALALPSLAVPELTDEQAEELKARFLAAARQPRRIEVLSPEPAEETERLRNELASVRQHRDALKAIYDHNRPRMERAVARWRAEDPRRRAITWPELGNLLDWLMDRADHERAAGYAEAIANLRDLAGYKRWHAQQLADTGVDHHRFDYLEAVGPGTEPRPQLTAEQLRMQATLSEIGEPHATDSCAVGPPVRMIADDCSWCRGHGYTPGQVLDAAGLPIQDGA